MITNLTLVIAGAHVDMRRWLFHRASWPAIRTDPLPACAVTSRTKHSADLLTCRRQDGRWVEQTQAVLAACQASAT